LAAGTNIDDGAITYSKLATAAVAALSTSGDNAEVVIGSQVFG